MIRVAVSRQIRRKKALVEFAATVPSNLRKPIRALLLETGLRDLALPWLGKRSNITGMLGSARMTLRYDADRSTLFIVERPDRIQPGSA